MCLACAGGFCLLSDLVQPVADLGHLLADHAENLRLLSDQRGAGRSASHYLAPRLLLPARFEPFGVFCFFSIFLVLCESRVWCGVVRCGAWCLCTVSQCRVCGALSCGAAASNSAVRSVANGRGGRVSGAAQSTDSDATPHGHRTALVRRTGRDRLEATVAAQYTLSQMQPSVAGRH